MKVIALYNIKGGVGKTTTAVNLACCASRESRVLLWDLDPQGAAGYALGASGGEEGGSRRFVQGRESLRSMIVPTPILRLDLIPSRFSYRRLDVILNDERHPRSVINALLKPLAADYDWVFLDCPPGIGLASENVFRAADILCIPLVPTPLSLRSFEEIVVFHKRKGLKRSVILPFFSLVEPRKKTHRQTMEVFRAREGRACVTFIPALAQIERMMTTRRPIARFRPGSVAGQSYTALWAEVRTVAEAQGAEGGHA